MKRIIAAKMNLQRIEFQCVLSEKNTQLLETILKRVRSKEHAVRIGERRQYCIYDYVDVAERWVEEYYCDIADAREHSALNSISDVDTFAKHRPRLQADVYSRIAEIEEQNPKHELIFILTCIAYDIASDRDLCQNWIIEEIASILREEHREHTIVLRNCKRKGGDIHYLMEAEEYFLAYAEKEMERILYPKRYCSIQEMNLQVSITGNSLRCEVEDAYLDQISDLRYDLYCDGILVSNIQPKVTYNNLWKLEKSGIYFVIAHIMCENVSGYRCSEPIEYFADEAKQYDCFLQKRDAKIPLLGQGNPLYYPAPYPFSDFVVISSSGEDLQRNTFHELCKHFAACDIGRIGAYHTTVFTAGNFRETKAGSVLFSGVGVFRGKVVEGVNALQDEYDKEDLLNQTGSYEIVISCSDSCIVARDYFSMSHLYYYMDAQTTIISNRYYLLLVAMREAGIECSLDTKKAAANLTIPGSYALLWNYSPLMDVEGAYQLPVNYDLVLDTKGWKFATNECGELISHKCVFHDELYRKQLHDAKEELIGLVDAYSHVDGYDGSIFSLTGGFDTRLVFGALNAQTDCKERISVRTDAYSGMRDVEVGASMNHLYPYPYDTDPIINEKTRLEDGDLYVCCVDLGTSYERQLRSIARSYRYGTRKALVSGVSGESTTRPFKTIRLMNRTESDLNSVDGLVSYFVERCVAVVVASKPYKNFVALYTEAVRDIPGNSPIERMECHHMAYSSGFHLAEERFYKQGMPWFAPLQSKRLFGAHLATLDLFRNYKLVLDMEYVMDAKLSSLPYEHEAYNEARSTLLPELIQTDIPVVNVDIDTEEWRESVQIQRQSSTTKYLDDDAREAAVSTEELDLLIKDALLFNLRELLLMEPDIEKQIGRALFHFICRDDVRTADLRIMYNKITSLLDQRRIIHD